MIAKFAKIGKNSFKVIDNFLTFKNYRNYSIKLPYNFDGLNPSLNYETNETLRGMID